MAPSEPERWLFTFNTTPSEKEVSVTPSTEISPFNVPPMVSLLPLILLNFDCTIDISHRFEDPIPQPVNALPPRYIFEVVSMVTSPAPLFMLPNRFNVFPVKEISPPLEFRLPMTRSSLALNMMFPP